MCHGTEEEHVRAALDLQENIRNAGRFRFTGIDTNNLCAFFLSPYDAAGYKRMRRSRILSHSEDTFRIFQFGHTVRHRAFT